MSTVATTPSRQRDLDLSDAGWESVVRKQALRALLQARQYRNRYRDVYDHLGVWMVTYGKLTAEAVLDGLQEDARRHAEIHQLLASIRKRIVAVKASTRVNVIHT